MSDLGTTDGTIKRLERQNTKLKAQVNNLRENLSCMATMEACADETGYIDGEGFVDRQKVLGKAVQALESTEHQSLKERDRQVILDAMKACSSTDISINTKPVCTVWDLEEYANNLIKEG